MSESKDFLSRWSQRKLNPQAEKPAAEDKPAAPDGAETAPAAPEFDIASLPPLESIGADSDIRVFLQQGVPSSLTRDALRRAWSADPAIRDFIGLSENSWDFNAPNPFFGFGPLDAEDAKKVAARFFGQLSEKVANAEAETVPAEEEKAAEPVRLAANEVPAEIPSAPDEAPDAHVALQQDDEGEAEEIKPAPKRHGGALPE